MIWTGGFPSAKTLSKTVPAKVSSPAASSVERGATVGDGIEPLSDVGVVHGVKLTQQLDKQGETLPEQRHERLRGAIAKLSVGSSQEPGECHRCKSRSVIRNELLLRGPGPLNDAIGDGILS